jgi:2-iminobutanoate/2-iminopropanoate deaminase
MKNILLLCMLIIGIAGCSQAPIDREIISTTDAPAAIGPYSQAVRAGNTLYLSGQLGIIPETGQFVEGGLKAQARQALENQKTILTEAGFSLGNVVQCQVFLKDMNDYRAFNEIYSEYFEKDYPARAVLEVSRIPKDGFVEIMMVAVK